MRTFDLDAIIRNTRNFFGIANQVNIFSNFPDREYVYSLLERVQSQEFELCIKAKFCYDHLKDILVAVDQRLLAAVIAVYKLQYNVIGYEFNYRRNNPYDSKMLHMKEKAKIVHFTGPKPWRDYPSIHLSSMASLFRFFVKGSFANSGY